jgi:hypothetical protein
MERKRVAPCLHFVSGRVYSGFSEHVSIEDILSAVVVGLTLFSVKDKDDDGEAK